MFTSKNEAISWLQGNASPFLPKNSKSYKYSVIASSIGVSTNFALNIDASPITGKVVECNEAFSVIKTGRNTFALVDPLVLRAPLVQGDEVLMTPYSRRRFDGARLSDPLRIKLDTGESIMQTTFGASVSELPIKTKTKFGANLINTLERLSCHDGFRNVSNMLVDIGANNFHLVEPDQEDENDTRDMQLSFFCTNSMFSGRVTVGVDAALDLFYLEMHSIATSGEEVIKNNVRNISLVSISSVISNLLCDGQWKYAKVEVLKTIKVKAVKLAATV